jgi:uncharacterized protein YceK
MKKIICILSVILLTGCGTIISRTPGPMQAQDHAIYGGVKTDLAMMKADNDMGVFVALDIPASIITDTILLPVDLVTWWARYEPCPDGKCEIGGKECGTNLNCFLYE